MAMTFFQSLRLNARRFPDKTAIHFNDTSITYSNELDQETGNAGLGQIDRVRTDIVT